MSTTRLEQVAAGGQDRVPSAAMNRSLSAQSRLNPSVEFLKESRKLLYRRIPFIASSGMSRQFETVLRTVASQSRLSDLSLAGKDTDELTSLSLSKLDLEELGKEIFAQEVVTAPLLLAVLVAVISQFLNGYNTGVMNAPEAVVFPGHSLMEWSLVVSAFAIGGPFGALIGGFCANRNGRAGALVICSWIFLVGGLLLALAPSISVLVLARFIVGLASGFSSVLVPVYLGEVAPPILRGTFGTCTQFSMVIGILMSGVFAFPLATASGWRFLMGITAVLAVLQLALSPYLLESPRWLLSRGYTQRAGVVLKKLMGLRDDEHVAAEIQNLQDAHEMTRTRHKSAHSGGAIMDLFYDDRVRLLLICCVVMHISQQLCGINAVFYYSTSFFNGVIDNPLLGTVIVAAVNVAATWLAQILMDRCFRRTLLLWSAGGMILSLVILTAALMQVVPNYMALVSVISYVAFFEIGLGPIPWLIVAEMFDAKYVATAQSLVCQINWVCNFIIGVAFPSLNAALGVWTFVPFAIVLVFAFIFTALYLPETLNRSVDEIQQLINGPEVLEFKFKEDMYEIPEGHLTTELTYSPMSRSRNTEGLKTYV